MRLKNKVAVITGGSRGIGFATADKFLQEGAAVIITASSPATAGRAAETLKEKHPESVVAGISPDLSSLDSVREAFQEIIRQYGSIDIPASTTQAFPTAFPLQNTRKRTLTV